MYNVFFTVALGTRSLKVTALVYSLGWGVFSALAGSFLPILQAAFFSPAFSEPKQIPTCCPSSGGRGLRTPSNAIFPPLQNPGDDGEHDGDLFPSVFVFMTQSLTLFQTFY